VKEKSVKKREQKMSDEMTTRNMPKFDGNDFNTWKFQITRLFIANGLLEIVDGTKNKPKEEAQIKFWERENAKAMFLISSSMEAKQLKSLITCETANEMWVRLAKIHEQKSASNKLILNQKYHEYRMVPEDSVVEHFTKVQNLAQQLRDIGQNIDDVSIMAKILGSLPPKYNAFRTAWDSMDEKRQTLDNLMERLIKEESHYSADDDAASALAAMTINKKKTSKKKNSSKPPNQSKKKDGDQCKKKDGDCYYCGKKGHYARDCRKKKHDNEEKRSRTSSSENCAFMLTGSSNSMPSMEDVQQLLRVGMEDVWLTDSGASCHVTFHREWLSDYRSVSGEKVKLGDDAECDVRGIGNVHIEKLVRGTWENATIRNVFFVPKIKKNLLSVGILTSGGYEVSFKDNRVVLMKNDMEYANGVKQNNDVYRMFFRINNPRAIPEANIAMSLKRWHERLGHVNQKTLCEMINCGAVNGIKVADVKNFFCDACQLGKSHKLPFKNTSNRTIYRPGEFIHSDVCGPLPEPSIGGARFFLTFVDESSGYRHVFFLRHKSDVYIKFKEFDKMVENKFGRKIQVIHADNGREYCNEDMR